VANISIRWRCEIISKPDKYRLCRCYHCFWW